jgi:hypothetical protein
MRRDGAFSGFLVRGRPPIPAIPASVTVPAGSPSTTFNVPTFSVSASTPVGITATTGGVSVQTTLTVNP